MSTHVIIESGLSGLGSAIQAAPPKPLPPPEMPPSIRPLTFGGLALALVGAGLFIKKKKLGAAVAVAGLATTGVGAAMWKRHNDVVEAAAKAAPPVTYIPGGIINDYLKPSVPADQWDWSKGSR